MEIIEPKIKSVSTETSVNFTESDDWFRFEIHKEDHGFYVQILKSGQYIFVSLLIDDSEFPIEHIEFYDNESDEDVLEELIVILNYLKRNPTRFNHKKRWSGIRMKVEVQEHDEWIVFGYPRREKKGNSENSNSSSTTI